MYKYDLHTSTSDFTYSGRSNISAEETVEVYVSAGYSGLVLTNPWGNNVLRSQENTGKDIKELVKEYLLAYEKLKSAAGNDLTVLLGAEMTVASAPGEILVYGVTPEFILNFDMDAVNRMWFTQFVEYIHSNGDMLVYQASPFAPGSILVDFNDVIECPEATIGGLEVYNHRKSDICNNSFAYKRAEYYRVGGISGSDLSYTGGTVGGGIATDVRITSNADLLSVLKNKEYRIIKEGKVENV